MLKTHNKPMGKEIKLRINACYGDLRPSEKKAADYVLKHLDELKALTLDRLAKNAGVSHLPWQGNGRRHLPYRQHR